MPAGGWPLDGLFVGVATLRTMRELFLQAPSGSVRAWDLALWSGVTPQGSADALERMCRAGFVQGFPSEPGHAARFLLAGHPLVEPMSRLFDAEAVMARAISRAARDRFDASHLDAPGGSATPA